MRREGISDKRDRDKYFFFPSSELCAFF